MDDVADEDLDRFPSDPFDLDTVNAGSVPKSYPVPLLGALTEDLTPPVLRDRWNAKLCCRMQIVSSNRRFEPGIRYELWPIDPESAADGLFVRSRYREVCWLLMQQEYVTMSGRRASRRRRTKV